jgi:hypothetical protein
MFVMATDNEPSTNDRIVMKDHDILISLHTQVGTLIGQVQNLTTQVQGGQQATYNEFRNMAVSQAKLEGKISEIESKLDARIVAADERIDALDDRIDSLDGKSVKMDIISYVAASVAAVIALFK